MRRFGRFDLLTLVGLVTGILLPLHTAVAVSDDIDQSHMRAALVYKDRPNQDNLSAAAFSNATDFIRRHNILSKRFPPQSSVMDITGFLVDKKFSSPAMEVINARIAAITDDGRAYRNCLIPARDYLPNAMQPESPLLLTWGYGIDVYLNGQAALDVTDPYVMASEENLWRACIRAYHNIGTTAQHRQLFSFYDATTSTEMLAYLEYRLFVEGVAEYAAQEAFPIDPTHEEVTPHLSRRDFDGLRASLRSSNQPLSDTVLDQAKKFDQDNKAILTIGNDMTRLIIERLGRERLNDGLLGGPATFMRLYDQARAMQ